MNSLHFSKLKSAARSTQPYDCSNDWKWLLTSICFSKVSYSSLEKSASHLPDRYFRVVARSYWWHCCSTSTWTSCYKFLDWSVSLQIQLRVMRQKMSCFVSTVLNASTKDFLPCSRGALTRPLLYCSTSVTRCDLSLCCDSGQNWLFWASHWSGCG